MTTVHARHEPVGDAVLSADLYAHVRLCFAVEGPRVHGFEERVRALPLRVGFGERAGGSVCGGHLGWLNPEEAAICRRFCEKGAA